MVDGWVLDFTRLMLVSTQVEVGVELGNILEVLKISTSYATSHITFIQPSAVVLG